MEKIKDTSNEEIEKGNHINYPLKLNTGEIVNNKKEFIYSKHWSKIKFGYMINSKKTGIKTNICEHCGKEFKKQFLQLHHLTYKNVGNESFEELIRICFNCHGKIHGKEEITKSENKSKKDIQKKNMLNLSSLILIGKYKNEKLTLRKLIEKDKQYVQWLINNDVIKLGKQAKDYFEKN